LRREFAIAIARQTARLMLDRDRLDAALAAKLEFEAGDGEHGESARAARAAVVRAARCELDRGDLAAAEEKLALGVDLGDGKPFAAIRTAIADLRAAVE